MESTHTYDGEERRMNCQAHEKNTSDLASLKGSVRTFFWLLGGIASGIALAVTVLINNLNTTSNDIKNLTTVVNTTNNIASKQSAQLEYMSQRMERLEDDKHGRR